MFLGMPYPQNLRTAKEVEGIVRENGAVPATIAILDGVPCVGIYHHLCLVYAFNLCHIFTIHFKHKLSGL
jgi:pseudouridine-5'-phosphate glycosidase